MYEKQSHFLCALQEWSLFSQSCGSPIIKSCWSSNSDSLGSPSPFARSLGWEIWWGAQNLHKVGELLGYYCYPVCGSPTRQVWNLILLCLCPSSVSLWLRLCIWTWDIFFGGFQCPPVNGCSAASCNFGVLAGGNEPTSCYSAILKQSPIHFSHC